LVALDATMHLHGPGGARTASAAAFFLDAYKTTCAAASC